MGNVVIAANIKRVSERIDTGGNVINARTKEIIKPIEPEYVPPVVPIEEIKQQEVPTTNSMSDKINKMVEAKIAEKIDAIVAQRVEEALSKL